MLTLGRGTFTVDKSRLLGKGGFGSVYVGHNTNTGQTVAVKECPATGSNNTGIQEIKSLTALPKGPQLVTLVDYFFERGSFWLVMEYCDLGNLEDYVRTARPNIQDTLKIMYQTAKAVEYLHVQTPKIVHRDIKLNNFLCVRSGETITIKISDFGLAEKTDNEGVLRTQVGCRPYLAPEIRAREPYTEAVDVFSLGLVYVVLINVRPVDNKLLPVTDESGDNGSVQYISESLYNLKMMGGSSGSAIKIFKRDSNTQKRVKTLINNMTQINASQRTSIVTVSKTIYSQATGYSSRWRPDLRYTEETEDNDVYSVEEMVTPLQPPARHQPALPVREHPPPPLPARETRHYDTYKTEADVQVTSAEDADDNDDVKQLIKQTIKFILSVSDCSDQLTCHPQFPMGGCVTLIPDGRKVRDNFPGWTTSMKKYLGCSGLVTCKKSKDIMVTFPNGRKFSFLPSLLRLSTGQSSVPQWIQDLKFKCFDVVRLSSDVINSSSIVRSRQSGHFTKAQYCSGIVLNSSDDRLVVAINFMVCIQVPPDVVLPAEMTTTIVVTDWVYVTPHRQRAMLYYDQNYWHRQKLPYDCFLGKAGIVTKVSDNHCHIQFQGAEKTFKVHRKCVSRIASHEEFLQTQLLALKAKSKT